jgi:hypothetical protein
MMLQGLSISVLQVVLLGLHAHLNSLFAHLIEFNIHYNTIEDKETEVLQVELSPVIYRFLKFGLFRSFPFSQRISLNCLFEAILPSDNHQNFSKILRNYRGSFSLFFFVFFVFFVKIQQ